MINIIQNLEAIGVEALFNFALVSNLMAASDEAFHAFQQLNQRIRNLQKLFSNIPAEDPPFGEALEECLRGSEICPSHNMASCFPSDLAEPLSSTQLN
jgi:hypothetical protein